MKKCQAAIQRGREATGFFQELKRDGQLPVVEPFWKNSSVRGEAWTVSTPSTRLTWDLVTG